jgi:hypothetical protein
MSQIRMYSSCFSRRQRIWQIQRSGAYLEEKRHIGAVTWEDVCQLRNPIDLILNCTVAVRFLSAHLLVSSTAQSIMPAPTHPQTCRPEAFFDAITIRHRVKTKKRESVFAADNSFRLLSTLRSDHSRDWPFCTGTCYPNSSTLSSVFVGGSASSKIGGSFRYVRPYLLLKHRSFSE